MCELTQSERNEYGIKLATTLGDIEDIEAEKKKNADHYKDRIAGHQARADELSRKVRDGKEWRDVECEVLLGSPDREHKQTIRLDTGETIRTERMTAADLQLLMPLDDESAESESAGAIEVDGVEILDGDGEEGWEPADDHNAATEDAREAIEEAHDDAPEYVALIEELARAKTKAKQTKAIEQFIELFGDTALVGVLELAKRGRFDEKKTEHLANFVREADPTTDY